MKHTLSSIYVPGRMANARHEAYSALFEAGGSPQKKTRKAIRNLLPPPPGGWDSTAQTPEGKPYVSVHGNELSWDQVLETYIRGMFLHNSGILEKYEPAIARIAYTELGAWPGDLMDYREGTVQPVSPGQFKAILRILSGPAHEGEYDFNLNGMAYDELVARYGKAGKDASGSVADTGRLNYGVLHVKSFAEASRYKDYTNNWCICDSKDYWNRYTARGRNTMYFLFAPGFEQLDGSERGEHYPYDRYSLSMIGAVIAPDGSLEYCCLRRNHEGGRLGDHELGEKQLGELLGRPVRTALPYVEPEGIEARGGKVEEIKKRLAAGETILDIYGEPVETLVDGLAQYLVGATHVIVDTSTGLPVTEEEASSVTILDRHTVAISMPVGMNEWDEDVSAWFIYHVPDHRRYLLGYTESDYSDAEFGTGAIDFAAIVDVDSTKVPRVYKVISNGESDAEALFGIGERGGLSMLSDWHSVIDYYEKDRVFVLDPSDNQWDSYENIGMEIIRIEDDGSATRLYLGVPQASSFYEYDGKSRINLMFEDNGTVYLLHEGEIQEDVVPGYHDMMEMHGSRYEGLVYLVDEDEEEGIVFSLKTMRVVAEHIPASPDRRNRERLYNDATYQLADGSTNMVTDEGILFDEGQDEIGYIGCPKTPIGKADFNLAIAKARGKDGSIRFVDIRTRKDIYGKPLPPNAEYPYTDRLYVGHTEDSKYALFELDGAQVSGKFAKLDAVEPDMVIVDEAGRYNMVDLDTGRFLFERPLHERPHYIGGSDRDDDESGTRKIHLSLFRVSMLLREGMKQTLAVGKYSSVRKDGGYMYGYRKLDVSDIGWHDGIEMFPNTGELVLITDEVPLPEGTRRDGLLRKYDLVTRVHDAISGKTSKEFDIDALKHILDRYARNKAPEAYSKFDNKAIAVAKSIAGIPDFIDWLDSQPTNGGNR